jgi:hypothetical protein
MRLPSGSSERDDARMEALRAYFSRTWWSLTLSGVLLLLTVAFAVWWIAAGADAPAQVEPLTIICGVAIALLELVRPGQQHPPEKAEPPPYVLLPRTFGRAGVRKSGDTTAPCAKVSGGARGRALAFRNPSIVQIGGSALDGLDDQQVAALNRGAAKARCLQVTGEEAVTEQHREGGDLIFQILPSYRGTRDASGRFDLDRLKEVVAGAPIRALEIDLRHRQPLIGSAEDGSCTLKQSRRHAEFADTDSLLDWVELLGAETGLPVGIRATVGDMAFWDELADLMAMTARGIDIVTIDSGPVADAPRFHEVVGLRFLTAISRVYGTFARRGLSQGVVFVGSPGEDDLFQAVAAFAIGCDVIELSSSLLPALGESSEPVPPWTRRPTLEQMSAEVTRGIERMRSDLVDMALAAGVEHPALIDSGSVEEAVSGRPLLDIYKYEPGWGFPSSADRSEIIRLMSVDM